MATAYAELPAEIKIKVLERFIDLNRHETFEHWWNERGDYLRLIRAVSALRCYADLPA